MIILSIDASTKSTGYALFEDKKFLTKGCITSSSTDLIKRIHIMVDGLKKLFDQYKISKVIVEEVRPEVGGNNIKTHRALLWLQGAIAMMIYDNYKIELEYIYPSEWRKFCGIHTGSGITRETLKKKDIEFAQNTFKVTTNDDEADAIGIGWGYIQQTAAAHTKYINFE